MIGRHLGNADDFTQPAKLSIAGPYPTAAAQAPVLFDSACARKARGVIPVF